MYTALLPIWSNVIVFRRRLIQKTWPTSPPPIGHLRPASTFALTKRVLRVTLPPHKPSTRVVFRSATSDKLQVAADQIWGSETFGLCPKCAIEGVSRTPTGGGRKVAVEGDLDPVNRRRSDRHLHITHTRSGCWSDNTTLSGHSYTTLPDSAPMI